MKTKVLMRIIPARRPVLMASCKIVVPLHFIAYTLYIWIRVVISGIDAPGIIDYVINTIFLYLDIIL